MKITKQQLRKIIQEEISSLHPASTRVASTREGELKVWLNLVGAHNIEKVLKGRDNLTDEVIAALRDYSAAN